MRCLEMQRIRTVVSGGEASALIQNEVLILSDEERQSLLDKAGISSSIEIGAAEVLAIKAELALPWHKLRFLRRYVTTYSNIQQMHNSNSLVFQVAQSIWNLSGWRGKDAPHFYPNCG